MERLTPLWLSMANTWSSFVSLYGEEPLHEWNHALAEFTEEQIHNGYLEARNAGLEFPPNLSVFVAYCRGGDNWESKRLHKPHGPYAEICDRSDQNLLENKLPDLSPEDALAEMRKTVGLK